MIIIILLYVLTVGLIIILAYPVVLELILSPFVVKYSTDDAIDVLDYIHLISTTTIDSNTYAIVTDKNYGSIQIINITNPTTPTPVSVVLDDPILLLDSLTDMHITTIDSNTYVIAIGRGGMQIIDITNPIKPTPISKFVGISGISLDMQQIHTVTIDSNTYAILSSYPIQRIQNTNITNSIMSPIVNGPIDDTISVYGVIQIINITNPSRPTGISSIVDDETLALGGAWGIHTTTMGPNTYAIVAGSIDNAIQIINITNPETPTPVSSIIDDETLVLDDTRNVDITTMGPNTYAILTSNWDHGIQIINITNPETPTPVSNIIDDKTTLLNYAFDIHITIIDSNTYAIVLGRYDNALQIINITNPETPTPVSHTWHTPFVFDYINHVDITTIGPNTYAIATGSFFSTALQIINITNPETPTLVGTIK